MLVTNPTNLYPFHSPSVSMAKVSLLNVLFRVNGSVSGNGYTTMTSHEIWHFVTLASWLSNQKKITSLGTGDLAFVSRGYCNWKDATGEKGAFNTHQKSATHKGAVEVIFTLPATTGNVGEMLSRAHARERLENRDYLLKLFQNIRFLSRQGIALRGHDDANSNFIQLLQLRSIDDSKILEYLTSKTDKYTSHQIQNEMLQVMALRILRDM